MRPRASRWALSRVSVSICLAAKQGSGVRVGAGGAALYGKGVPGELHRKPLRVLGFRGSPIPFGWACVTCCIRDEPRARCAPAGPAGQSPSRPSGAHSQGANKRTDERTSTHASTSRDARRPQRSPAGARTGEHEAGGRPLIGEGKDKLRAKPGEVKRSANIPGVCPAASDRL